MLVKSIVAAFALWAGVMPALAHDPLLLDTLGEGEIVWNGVRYKVVVSPEDTEGRLSVTDSISPANSGPPQHVHHDADEIFIVLSGEHTFWVDGETFTRGPGEIAFVPRGVPHTFRTYPDGPSRHLIVLAPAGFEAYFAEVARRGLTPLHDREALAEVGSRFSLEYTGPPLPPAE